MRQQHFGAAEIAPAQHRPPAVPRRVRVGAGRRSRSRPQLIAVRRVLGLAPRATSDSSIGMLSLPMAWLTAVTNASL